jgi:hypothetical protein
MGKDIVVDSILQVLNAILTYIRTTNKYVPTVRPVPASILIYLKRVESSSAESNMLHPGCIQVRKSNETEKYKCASPEEYLTQLSFPPSRDK